MRKTKIVCTMGPATDDGRILKKIMRGGMDVARFNFSHGDYTTHKMRMDSVKKAREELRIPVAIMLDTKGPEVRIGRFENGGVTLAQGTEFILTPQQCMGTDKKVSISYARLSEFIEKGTLIYINDGNIKLEALQIKNGDIICRVLVGGELTDRKSVNVPGVPLGMEYVSPQDEEDILFGIENEVDYIAASFVRSAADVLDIRRILEKNGAGTIHIIAKIENREGVDNIDEILKVSDGIMVARGDMGVEIPFEELPHIQKVLIKKGYMAGKKAICATQMLESMVNNPRPTRAEATDVANAIYDGTSAVMLSSETSVGKYPDIAVETICKIAEQTESVIDYRKRFNEQDTDPTNVADAISHATVTTAHDLRAAAIVTVTKTGNTARMISKYRPSCPIISCTTDARTERQLSLSWGVIPLLIDEKKNTDELFEYAVESAQQAGLLKFGDLVAITSGVPLGIPGTTNILKVHIVGHILVTGTSASEKAVVGKLCVGADEEEILNVFEDGDIVVLPETSNNIMNILKKAGGIITEAGGVTSHAAIVGLSLDIPVICGAAYATKILRTGTVVTMDSEKGIVYSGVMGEIL